MKSFRPAQLADAQRKLDQLGLPAELYQAVLELLTEAVKLSWAECVDIALEVAENYSQEGRAVYNLGGDEYQEARSGFRAARRVAEHLVKQAGGTEVLPLPEGEN
jgi:hypothetical protein